MAPPHCCCQSGTLPLHPQRSCSVCPGTLHLASGIPLHPQALCGMLRRRSPAHSSARRVCPRCHQMRCGSSKTPDGALCPRLRYGGTRGGGGGGGGVSSRLSTTQHQAVVLTAAGQRQRGREAAPSRQQARWCDAGRRERKGRKELGDRAYVTHWHHVAAAAAGDDDGDCDASSCCCASVQQHREPRTAWTCARQSGATQHAAARNEAPLI